MVGWASYIRLSKTPSACIKSGRCLSPWTGERHRSCFFFLAISFRSSDHSNRDCRWKYECPLQNRCTQHRWPHCKTELYSSFQTSPSGSRDLRDSLVRVHRSRRIGHRSSILVRITRSIQVVIAGVQNQDRLRPLQPCGVSL